MTEITDNVFNKEKSNVLDNVWYKSVRMTINLLVNILIFFTVFVCLLYSCSSEVTLFDLHIILCVLGYQFCMCQGTLIMSPYNSWSIFIARRYKKHIHWVLQVLAAVLVTAGTVLIIRQKSTHFNSIHGKLVLNIDSRPELVTRQKEYFIQTPNDSCTTTKHGLAALVCCLSSLLNGILAMYPLKLSSCIGVFWVRFFHYITGIASMFLATGSLCAAFEYRSFKTWTGNADVFVPTLVSSTWLFTILVSLDFWIVTGNKIRSLI